MVEGVMNVESVMQVAEFFNWDMVKTQVWFDTPNYQLGGISPNQITEFGREEKLVEVIKYMVGEEE